ncbi:FAD-binding molybdopterin dehydrogenase [Alsobacter soli]|uniref:FAD-binding molybdopterin dehydrogenase n=1 Tax=Alsobacter soli TaxID=2109933 RepID=A0A2T1HPN9_9HYPH|nr:xanthine dehydrogenase family protein subunit M [Alsobacter soli]PSC03593.1 FAD-binding molybdopterin dehydrogenase [Alsobacter soli]
MRPFIYTRADDVSAAVQAAAETSGSAPANAAPVQFIAGGTTILDLMKLDTMRPERLVDINGLQSALGSIQATDKGLRLGALVRMSQAAEDPQIQRDYPVIAQSLQLAASAQLRNMASLGGNVLQRTRCQYFRNTSWPACNKRDPGSGCAALDGVNRKHAVLGVGDKCIAEYPGDFAPALAALGAVVTITGPNGSRAIPFEQLHRGPDQPERETTLAPGELITGFDIPAGPYTRRSLYVKVRDRQSYEFGLATAAVALHLVDGKVEEARIGLGGVAYRPWRSHEAEAALQGKPLDENSAEAAAQAAFAEAAPRRDNAYKVELGRRTLVRALLEAGRMEI